MYKRKLSDSSNGGSWAGAAVAAAFLGPGTVTTCSMTGVSSGTTMLWVLLAAFAALLISQDLCVRLGAAGRISLSELLAREIPNGWRRALALTLITVSIGVGCAAYQAGNLRGAAVGLQMTTALGDRAAFAIVAICAVLLLCLAHRLDVLVRLLAGLILLMTVAFLGAAILARPNLGELARGLLVPSLPHGSDARGALLSVAALVGTTIVPYNLFLHSSLVRDRSNGPEDLHRERRDSVIFLGLGILASMAVVVATSRFHGLANAPTNLSEMGRSLESLGVIGPWVFSIGLFAAGLSSALTAPIAAGLALEACLRNHPQAKAAVRWTVMAVGLACGLLLDQNPERLIQLAQVTNAIMLPVALAFLWWAARRPRLGAARAGWLASSLAGLVTLLGLALSLRTGWLLFAG